MLRAFLLVGAGGAVGSMARYGVSYFVNKLMTHPFPFATFFINVLGSFIIGLLFGLGQKYEWLQGDAWLILASGFCGGFTTFSTFALENSMLLDKQQSFTAILYSVISVLLGIALCKAGIWLTR